MHRGLAAGLFLTALLAAPAARAEPEGAPPGAGLTLAEVVDRALVLSPEVLLERASVESARGAQLVEEAPFDLTLAAAAEHQQLHTPLGGDLARRDSITALSVSLAKTLGFGLRITPRVRLEASSPSFSAATTSTTSGLSSATVELELVQPLLRGLGGATSAGLDAARLAVRAAGHDLQHVLALRVLAVSNAYWEYVQRARSVEILAAAEKRAERILADGRALVKADERPKADLEPLEANLADRTRARLAAELALADARRSLGLEVGLSAEEVATLALPATLLPEPPAAEPALALDPLVERARADRRDLLAASERADAAKLLVSRAENGTLPDLQLVAALGYTGSVDGTGAGELFLPLASRVPGLNARIGLSLAWPFAESAARGAELEARATLRRAEVTKGELVRRAAVNVSAARDRLVSSLRSLERARRSSVHHRASLENERAKLEIGQSTVIDVVLTEDRMTEALLAELAEQTAYAQAIARLAFETGALATGDGDRLTVEPERLLVPPAR